MTIIVTDNVRPEWGIVGRRPLLAGGGVAVLPFTAASANAPDAFDVRKFGAKGDGRTLDTAAIQRAINAAAAAGGGTVFFPKGRFLSFSLQLKSHITLYFGSGAVLLAADPAKHKGHYDLAEPNPYENFQDYGHSYFHNSLIWGENLDDIALLGPGMIDGEGLTNVSPNAPWSVGVGRDDLPQTDLLKARIADHYASVKKMSGLGNKAIALKNSRNITMRDFTILRGGHFGILATGVDNLTIDNLKIDTNRDGIDIDVVRNCRVSNCSVNSPTDDAIVLKSSYALGEARPTENVTITNCFVSGFAVGSLLDGSYKREQLKNIEPHLTSGRIKLGTESTGGYRNIAVSNCVFDCCNGLALESVDGAVLEDVVVSNLVMRDTTAAPIFLRLGDRRRAPKGAPMAALRRVSVSDIDCHFLDKRYCSIVRRDAGLRLLSAPCARSRAAQCRDDDAFARCAAGRGAGRCDGRARRRCAGFFGAGDAGAARTIIRVVTTDFGRCGFRAGRFVCKKSPVEKFEFNFAFLGLSACGALFFALLGGRRDLGRRYIRFRFLGGWGCRDTTRRAPFFRHCQRTREMWEGARACSRGAVITNNFTGET